MLGMSRVILSAAKNLVISLRVNPATNRMVKLRHCET